MTFLAKYGAERLVSQRIKVTLPLKEYLDCKEPSVSKRVEDSIALASNEVSLSVSVTVRLMLSINQTVGRDLV